MGSVGDFQAKPTRGVYPLTPKAAAKENQAFPENLARSALRCDASAHRSQSKRPLPRERIIDFAATALEDLQQTLIGEPADFS